MVICSIHLNALGSSLIFMKGETLRSMPSTQWTEGESWGPGWNALPASSASPYPPILPNVLCVIEFLSLSFFGSCRSGCKFSSEEERLVVEMQAKLGNKWAKIDSCLPGRTDNDVKNFWSTRQKRIWRALQQPKMMMMVTSAGTLMCLQIHRISAKAVLCLSLAHFRSVSRESYFHIFSNDVQKI